MRVCDNIDGYGFKSFLIRRMVMVLNLIVPYLTLPPRPKIVRASSCISLPCLVEPFGLHGRPMHYISINSD